MKWLFLALSSTLAIVAQMIAGNNFFLFNFLDISMVLIAYWAMERSRTQALFVGSLTGLLFDAALGWPIGYNGFGKTLAAFGIGVAARRFNIEGAPIRFLLVTCGSCLNSAAIFALFELLGRQPGRIFLGASLVQALITGAVGAMMLSMLDAYRRAHPNRAN
jgi:rod shape-determining protein MreD